jgi:hypothetical protein
VTITESSFPSRPGQDYPVSEAVISADGLYRYVLNRRWADGPVMPWLCLNPSTADATIDDPSIRRMCGFARREGCGGICVLNLYAVRSPSPDILRTRDRFKPDLPDPVGPDNDTWLAGLADLYPIAVIHGDPVVPVVAAWGAHPLAAARVPRVLELLAGVPLVCLGTTRKGAPKHPLYVRGDAPLIPWPLPDSPYWPRRMS